MKLEEGFYYNYNNTRGGQGICVTLWYTCLWGPGWGWCGLCGLTLAVVLIVFLYCYLRDRKDTIRVKGAGSRRD